MNIKIPNLEEPWITFHKPNFDPANVEPLIESEPSTKLKSVRSSTIILMHVVQVLSSWENRTYANFLHLFSRILRGSTYQQSLGSKEFPWIFL